MDQVIIRDIKARGIIGVNASERDTEQDILINIILFADLELASQTDQLAHSIDYSEIARRALATAETAKRFTVEGLAEDIAVMCLENPRVQKVRVRVEKPGAILYATSAGAEIERVRRIE